jgi:hypothetical protein
MGEVVPCCGRLRAAGPHRCVNLYNLCAGLFAAGVRLGGRARLVCAVLNGLSLQTAGLRDPAREDPDLGP